MVTTRSGKVLHNDQEVNKIPIFSIITEKYKNILNEYELDLVYKWVTHSKPLLTFNKNGSVNKGCSIYRTVEKHSWEYYLLERISNVVSKNCIMP